MIGMTLKLPLVFHALLYRPDWRIFLANQVLRTLQSLEVEFVSARVQPLVAKPGGTRLYVVQDDNETTIKPGCGTQNADNTAFCTQ